LELGQTFFNFDKSIFFYLNMCCVSSILKSTIFIVLTKFESLHLLRKVKFIFFIVLSFSVILIKRIKVLRCFGNKWCIIDLLSNSTHYNCSALLFRRY
jgi:hypothetical protein